MTKGFVFVLLAGVIGLPSCSSVKAVRQSFRCQDMQFPIYFSEGSDTLTPIASQAIATAADKARGCHVGTIRVTGLADASGGALANLQLSQRRAATVTAALAAQGLPSPAFDVDAKGEQGAVLANGRTAPMQRRTDVEIHFVR